MQISGTFPALSDNTRKTVRRQIKLQSPIANQKGSAVGGSIRRHAGSTAANRQKARNRARGKV